MNEISGPFYGKTKESRELARFLNVLLGPTMKEEAYPEDERNRLVREIFEGSRAAKVTFVKPENEWAYATTQAWHAVITTGRETFPHDIPGYLMALLANQPARKGETRTFGSRG